mgnify:CR=1 FL=1
MGRFFQILAIFLLPVILVGGLFVFGLTLPVPHLGRDYVISLTLPESGQPVDLPHENRSDQRLRLDDLKYGTVRAIRDLLETEYRYLSGFYDNPL